MGLGTVQERNNKYLTVAGGYIWDKRADESDPNYAVQEYSKTDGEVGQRKGAQYGDISGRIKAVLFRNHDKYGQSINITIQDGDESFILSISTNNQYSQSMMKALMIMDLEKDIFLKPYDFTDSVGKRAQGISFRQNGQKLDLKEAKVAAEFQRDASFWKDKSPSGKKAIKRYFEDLDEWFVAEVETEIKPKLELLYPEGVPTSKEKTEDPKQTAPKTEAKKPTAPKAEAPKEEPKPTAPKAEGRPSVIKMRKAIKAYIEENYEGESLPKLTKDQINEWYDLVQAEEELPFDSLNDVPQEDLKDQLNALMSK